MRNGGDFGGTLQEGGAVVLSDKSIFVTGTGTDIGKTYVSDLIIKKLRDAGYTAGYYKAAASGVENVPADKFVSYVYKDAVSPHLAAKIAKRPIDFSVIERDFYLTRNKFDFLVVEGSGGIICPLRWDNQHLILDDVVKRLNLPVIIVADSGLGTINATALTVEHLINKKIPVKGLILNRFQSGNLLHIDNEKMLIEMLNLPIIAKVPENATALDIDAENLTALF